MIALLVAVVVVGIINTGFAAVMGQIISNPGLFEQIIFIGAYTALVVTALNKAFSLIYHLPERITTYIGGHAVQYGEGEALGQAKAGVEGAGRGVSGLGQQAGGTAVSAAGKVRQENEAKASKQATVGDDKKPPNP